MSIKTYMMAINEALAEEMRRDETTVLFGEDVALHGGIFGATRGLMEEFGENRVMDCPISEEAITGAALGAAISGTRPIAEIMYGDFLLCAMNEMFHNIPKWTWLLGGQYKAPLVIRCAEGASNGAGAEHSNCLASLFMHSPGWKICCPSTPEDAKGMLKSAIREDGPVLFFEHKQLYKTKGEVPDEDYIVPLGKAKIRREGKSVTIVTISRMVNVALEAAEKLADRGIDAEVIDLRTLMPFDKETVFNSIRKTHRAIVVEEGNLTCGIASEFSATIQEELFDELDAPVGRVAALDVPLPYNLTLEAYCLPNVEKIIAKVNNMF